MSLLDFTTANGLSLAFSVLKVLDLTLTVIMTLMIFQGWRQGGSKEKQS